MICIYDKLFHISALFFQQSGRLPSQRPVILIILNNYVVMSRYSIQCTIDNRSFFNSCFFFLIILSCKKILDTFTHNLKIFVIKFN